MSWSFTWPITIDATNNKINFKEDGGAELTATLTSGDYRDIIGADTTNGSLAKEIKTQLEDAGAGTYTVTVSDDGVYAIAVSGAKSAVQLLWSTGLNAATSPRYLLGWTAADTSSAASLTATYQHYHGVYSSDGGPDQQRDTSLWRSKRLAPMRRANSGKMARWPIGSTQEYMDLTIGFLPLAKTRAATTSYDAYKSLEDLFDYLMAGDHRYFRWHADTAIPTTYTDVWWEVDEYNPDRHSPGVELFTVDLKLWKHV